MKEQIKEYFKDQYNRVFLFLLGIAAFFIVTAFVMTPAKDLFAGVWTIYKSPDILITDYLSLANFGAAFFNAGTMTLIVIIMIRLCKVPFTGISIAATLITTGFSLFGKNPANAWPIVLGVFLYSLFRKEKFSKNINTAVFGMTMGPVVSEIFSYSGWPLATGIILSIVVGIAIGFFLPAIANLTMGIHQGYVLYNVGVAAGTIVVAVVSIFRVFGIEFSAQSYYSTEYTKLLTIMFLIIFALFIMVGLLIDKKSFIKALKINKQSGRAVSDFVVRDGFEATIINMGLLGIISVVFTRIVGAPINGPTLGAILTIVGFGAFGNHPRNVIYLFIGGAIGHLCGLWDFATQPVAIIAALFATGIAPIGGQYGWFWGIISGFLHIFIVQNVGRIHAGLTLYSNGFAGMFDAIILLPIIGIFRDSPYINKLKFWRKKEQ